MNEFVLIFIVLAIINIMVIVALMKPVFEQKYYQAAKTEGALYEVRQRAIQHNVHPEFWESYKQIRPWWRMITWIPFLYRCDLVAADLVSEDLDL